MIKTNKLYIFYISLVDLDLHSRSQLYTKSKILVSIFSQILMSIWVKFRMLPQPVGLLKFMLNLFLQVVFKGENSADVILLYDYAFNVVMCWDTCLPICFKLGIMLDTTKFYSLIPWSSLNDLHVCSSSQGFGKASTCAVILLVNCIKQLKCSWWLIM